MSNLGLVDRDSFYQNMILEIMSTDDKICNYYYLTREKDKIYFNGNGQRFYQFTEVTDDTQLKEYYDKLSSTFNTEFKELIIYGDSYAELVAVIKDKIICIDSDNNFDDWIFEKEYLPKYLQKEKPAFSKN